MRQSIQVPTDSLDVRGPFGQDELYETPWFVPSPLIHELRCVGLSFRPVVHSLPTIVAVLGSAEKGPCPSNVSGVGMAHATRARFASIAPVHVRSFPGRGTRGGPRPRLRRRAASSRDCVSHSHARDDAASEARLAWITATRETPRTKLTASLARWPRPAAIRPGTTKRPKEPRYRSLRRLCKHLRRHFRSRGPFGQDLQ
jgi:hypothetical protein